MKDGFLELLAALFVMSMHYYIMLCFHYNGGASDGWPLCLELMAKVSPVELY